MKRKPKVLKCSKSPSCAKSVQPPTSLSATPGKYDAKVKKKMGCRTSS
jgi:hypothetical protein